MNIVLLQERLSDEDIQKLISEFPRYIFLAPSELSYHNLGHEEWSQVEIFYGNRLSSDELAMAHQLRWVHSPTTNLNALCLNEINKRENVLVSCTREENIHQIGEYALSGILAFAKNLFHWEEADRNPIILWDSKWRESMWTLKDKVLLQIGLGKVGTEIARRAKMMDMRVWGIQEHRSFHPNCRKVFSYNELHSILPAVDIISLALPRTQEKDITLGKKELELMKDDSILVIIGSKSSIDEGALFHATMEKEKFRGILLDASYQTPISPTSKLWKIPNMIITPEVAPRPKAEEKESFRIFRHNLRQYIHGNYSDMRNLVGTKSPLTP